MDVTAWLAEFGRSIFSTAADVLPVALFMLIFYRVVLKQKLANRAGVLVGLGLVIVGLTLLLLGLDKALFPVGRMMVEQLTAGNAGHHADAPPHWTSYYPIYAFAFCIAFGAAIAEPALLAIALRVNQISGGAINALGLRVAAAVGVACGVTLGCIRIVADIPLYWCVGAAYGLIIIQTFTTPRSIVPLAYDSGGVSTTAVTVPVVTALGLGLAEQLPGRNPLVDGFGLITLACAFPAVALLAYAQASWLLDRIQWRRNVAGKTGAGVDKEN